MKAKLIVLLLALAAVASQAGVVVTSNRHVTVGELSVENGKLVVKMQYGSVRYSRDQVLWYTRDASVKSLYDAALLADKQKQQGAATILYEASIDKEPANKASARASLAAMRAKLAPTPAETPRPTATAAPSPPKRPENVFSLKYRHDLVQVGSDGKVVDADLPDLGGKKYYAIYFSAHWCPPCRSFTPRLAKFYNETREKYGDQYEIIFCSRDKDQAAFDEYMTTVPMPWPAIRFKDAAYSPLFTKYGGHYIPCLVVLSPTGEVLVDTNVDGKYRGPDAVVTDLLALMQGGK